MLRGTPYEKIEHPAKFNEPNFKLIEEIMEKYKQDAQRPIVSN